MSGLLCVGLDGWLCMTDAWVGELGHECMDRWVGG